jgi:hypothetical protein
MHVTARQLALVVGLGLACASPGFAQVAIAHLSQIEGTVTRLHRFAVAGVSVGVVLVEGDQIVTAVGRAELTFVDGSVMHLDQHTQVAIAGPARIRLIDGRISLRTTTAYTAETATGIVHVLPEGVFELTANASNRDVLVSVVEGDARIESPWGFESVRSTQTAFVSGPTGRPFVTPWIQTRHDSFVQWCNSRYVAIASASARFETGELRRDLAVATFGREGGPPPTFLPYAHPTYRQFAYERSLRGVRRDRGRADGQIRGAFPDGAHQIRGERRRVPSASAGETSGEQRRDRAGLSAVPPAKMEAPSGRDGAPVRRTDSRQRADRDDRPRTAQPAPPRRSSPVRGSTKGLAVRRP